MNKKLMSWKQRFLSLCKRLFASLYSNWPYKLVSLLFAVLLWAYVLGEVNPEREKTLSNVSVQFTGIQQLNEQNLTTTESLDGMAQNVRVSLRAPRQDLSLLSEQYVTLTADLSRITSEGTFSIPIVARTSLGRIVAFEPSEIEVQVERQVTKTIPVNIVTTGKLDEALWMDSPRTSTQQLIVVGAASVVDRIVEARVPLDLSTLTTSINRAVDYVLCDAEGKEVSEGSYTVDRDVMLAISVYEKRLLPVDVENSITGRDHIREGYEITEIIANPEKIWVAASAETFDNLKSIPFETIDLANKDVDTTYRLALRMPENVVWMETNSIDVIVRIREIQDAQQFTLSRVQVYRHGVAVETVNETVTVTVMGPRSAVERLTASDIELYAEASDKSGRQTLDVRARTEDSSLEVTVVPQTITVTLP